MAFKKTQDDKFQENVTVNKDTKAKDLIKSKSLNKTNESTNNANLSKPRSKKTTKSLNKDKASDVLQKNQDTSNNILPKNRKHHKLNNPILIKVFYKKNKISKLRKNYGANFSDFARYSKSLVLANNYAQRKAEENETAVKKHGRKKDKKENKKKNLLNFLYFFLNVLVIAIVLGIQLSSEPNPQDSITVIFAANWWFLLCAFGMFLLSIIGDQVRCSFLLRKATGRFRTLLSYKIVAIGRYYDVITPLSVGGQPFQIFYANKYGVKAGDGISIITAKYVFQQITYFIVVSYILFRNLIKNTLINAGIIEGGIQDSIVSTFSWIGYAATAALLFVIIFMALNKRMGSKFVAGTFKLLSKIRIGKFRVIKDYNKSFINTMKTVNSWQVTTKKYFHSPLTILINVVFALVTMFANYTVPFFIYCAFAGWQPDAWIIIVTMAVIVELSSAFNPIPMGIGTADLGFKVLYGTLFALSGVSTAFVWAYIIWRVLAYYIFIIQGLGVITYDYAIGNKKLAKYKVYWLLPFKERCKVKKDAFLRKNK